MREEVTSLVVYSESFVECESSLTYVHMYVSSYVHLRDMIHAYPVFHVRTLEEPMHATAGANPAHKAFFLIC